MFIAIIHFFISTCQSTGSKCHKIAGSMLPGKNENEIGGMWKSVCQFAPLC